MANSKINWGIIGCGDVAEVKSGPAFNQVEGSRLLAVMRRNIEKAASFAERHHVPHFFSNVDELLRMEKINAVYIATPPSSHLEIAIQSIEAGKMVYLEKPMVLNLEEAKVLEDKVKDTGAKVCVAHYRRGLPAFSKVKELLKDGVIGAVRLAEIQIRQPLKSGIVANSEEHWRTNVEISGGGYFYDLAPHQIDLMLHYFGEVDKVIGIASNQSKEYQANDMINGMIQFKNGIHFTGTWAFNVNENQSEDRCTIYGEKGSISFSFYGDKVITEINGSTETHVFDNPKHIQLPMIKQVAAYFQGKTIENPCSVSIGKEVIRIMETIKGGQ